MASQLYTALVPSSRPSIYGELVFVNASHSIPGSELWTARRDPSTSRVDLQEHVPVGAAQVRNHERIVAPSS